MVWLGIDLGDARVGLALSDPELTLAHPIGNIQVYGDSFRALDEVIDVIGDESVDHVVIGSKVTMGARCTVLYSATVGDGVQLGPLTLVMKGESLPERSNWEGAPAAPARPRAFPA